MNKSDISKNLLTITAVSLILGLTACSSSVITDHTDSNILFENDNNSLDGKTINGDNVVAAQNAQYPVKQDNNPDTGNSFVPSGGEQNSPIDNSVNSQSDNDDTYTVQNEESADGISGDSQNTASDCVSFYSTGITPEIFDRISGKSYPADTDNCEVSLDELSYCHVLFYGFDGLTHEGELIVNTAVAADILDIFEELYKNNYPIERMVLIDEYDANDELSMRDNNTSAFNYRVVSGSTTLSNHSYGLAIDINPLYNPYVVNKSNGDIEVQPATAGDYIDRTNGNPHYILKDDLCYRLFIDHGFTWGGDWNTKKDYQHFEKKLDQ